MKTRKLQDTHTALDGLMKRYVTGKPHREQSVQAAVADAELATLIYDLRTCANLTQQQLADLVGTQKSAISRLEDSNYSGHSLAMLRRIADALGFRVRVVIEPANKASSERKRSSYRELGTIAQHSQIRERANQQGKTSGRKRSEE